MRTARVSETNHNISHTVGSKTLRSQFRRKRGIIVNLVCRASGRIMTRLGNLTMKTNVGWTIRGMMVVRVTDTASWDNNGRRKSRIIENVRQRKRRRWSRRRRR
jgi:predicted chitinase